MSPSSAGNGYPVEQDCYCREGGYKVGSGGPFEWDACLLHSGLGEGIARAEPLERACGGVIFDRKRDDGKECRKGDEAYAYPENNGVACRACYDGA